jgi:putative addiction module killer protein
MVTDLVPEVMLAVEYLASTGASPFRDWFNRLDSRAAAKVTVAIGRLEQGNLSNVKGVGGGVLEYRIDFGPGYRVYFGRDGRYSHCPVGWRHQAKAATGYRDRTGALGGLQASEEGEMTLWR